MAYVPSWGLFGNPLPTHSQGIMWFLSAASTNPQLWWHLKGNFKGQLVLWSWVTNLKVRLGVRTQMGARGLGSIEKRTSSCFPAFPALGNSMLMGFLSRSTCLHCSLKFVANYFYTVGNNIKLALLPGTLDGCIWVSLMFVCSCSVKMPLFKTNTFSSSLSHSVKPNSVKNNYNGWITLLRKTGIHMLPWI